MLCSPANVLCCAVLCCAVLVWSLSYTVCLNHAGLQVVTRSVGTAHAYVLHIAAQQYHFAHAPVVLHLAGPPPRLDLLLERGPASPSCHLPRLPPPPPPALDALKVPVSMGHLYPPADILPHPSGANISDLPQHNPLPGHQSWGPELDPQLYGFESLGGPFSPSGPLRIPQVRRSFSTTQ